MYTLESDARISSRFNNKGISLGKGLILDSLIRSLRARNSGSID